MSHRIDSAQAPIVADRTDARRRGCGYQVAPAFLMHALLASAFLGSGFSTAWAQLPATRIAALFPAGAKQGSECEVTIAAGTDLEGVNRLWFSHPGITAVQKTQMVEGQPNPQPVANQFRVSVAADVPPGLYEARAIGTYGISNPRAFAIGDRNELAETEPNQGPAQATEISLGSWVNGRVETAKDIDWFRFAAKAGDRVIIDVWAERIDSRMDATLELFDANGRLWKLVRDFNHHDPLMDFRVPADGEYRIKLYDFQFRGGLDYFYRLGIGTGPYIDFLFPPAGQPESKASYTVYGRNLPGGTPAEGVELEGQPLEKVAVEIELPGDALARQRLTFDSLMEPSMAALDGVNYRMGSAAGTSNPVLLSLATAPIVAEQEPQNDSGQAVMPPCECVGQFAARNDRDVYTFVGKKGEIYWIEVYSQRLGSPSDPLLIVEQSTKNDKGETQVSELKAEDDSAANVGGESFKTISGDPVFRLACAADAEYRVSVRDLYSTTRGSPRLLYRLAIRREQPDFRLVALPDYPINGQQAPNPWTNFLRKGGTDMLRVLALRQDGFNGEIGVTVEGLPDGVTCRPATIGPGQVGTMLVFQATEQAADWVGAIRVVGRAKIGEAEVTREARPATVIVAAVNQRGIARLARDLALAVGQSAPYLVESQSPEIRVLQSQWMVVPIKATRRGDFAGALALTAVGLAGGVQNEAINLNPDQTQTDLYLFAQADAAPGKYTIYVQSSTQVPFTKNADGKDKKPVAVVDASTPIDIVIAPGPLQMAPQVPSNGNVKQGAVLEIPVPLTRRNNFAGPVVLDLYLPPGTAGISAAAVQVPADQNMGKLAVQVAADAAEGARAHVAVRAQVELNGQKLELHQPIAIVVQKK